MEEETKIDFVNFMDKYTEALTKMMTIAKKSKLFPVSNFLGLKTCLEMLAQKEESEDLTNLPILLDKINMEFDKACSQASLEEIETVINQIQRVIAESSTLKSEANVQIEADRQAYRKAQNDNPEVARDLRDSISKNEEKILEAESALLVREQIMKSLNNLRDIKNDEKKTPLV